MEYILAIIIFLFIFLLVISLAAVFNREERIIKERIDEYIREDFARAQAGKVELEGKKESSSDATEVLQILKESQKEKGKGLAKIVRNIGEILTPEKVRKNIIKKLERADVPLKETEFVAIIFFLEIFFNFLAFAVFKSLFMAVIFSVLAFYGPFLVLDLKYKKRVQAFNDQLLDNLVMISNSLKAGYSFLQALDMVAKEGKSPSKEEFGRVIRECALGKSVEDALRDMNERVGSDDLDLVITVVLIQRQVGGNLAEILDKISSTIRDRIKLKGEIRTLTAQGRISGLIVGLLPIFLGIMLYIINPDYMKTLIFFREGNFRGWYLLAFGFVLQVIGVLIIKKITDIDI